MEKRIIKMIVLNAEPLGYSQVAKKIWAGKGFTYQASSWPEIESTTSFPGIRILIVRLQRKVDHYVLSKFPDLQIIVSATTGHDHLDLKALEDRKIRLVSLRGQDEFLKTIPSTPEHCFGLLLSLVRNIPAANQSVKAGNWNRDAYRGYQLKNKTLGIIGLGRTGRMMAGFGKAFGMKPVYFDPFVNETAFERVNHIEDMLRISDVVSLHVHLDDNTKYLLNKDNLRVLKSGCFLLNTSRGDVWQEEAIDDLLRSKHILGVATDVLSGELSDIRSSILWQAQQDGLNIIITPHLGGATYDAMWACEEFIVSLI